MASFLCSMLLQFALFLSLHTTHGQIDINCIGEDSCKSQTLICPTGLPCTITCEGKAACIDSEIVGFYSTDVTLICNGEDACKPTMLSCGTGDCYIDCQLGFNVCSGIDVQTFGAKSFQCDNNCPAATRAMAYTAYPTKYPTRSVNTEPIFLWLLPIETLFLKY